MHIKPSRICLRKNTRRIQLSPIRCLRIKKNLEQRAKEIKEFYETPCDEADELIRKANESPVMPSGMTREEEIEWILNESNKL